jgi:1-deoxy-D-xylulose-5-phosphate reductoisomerase
VGNNAGMEFTREPPRETPRDVVVLGSTGSIGTQAADIIRRNPGRFRVAGLAAGGGNAALLASQAVEFGADVVAVASEAHVDELRRAIQAEAARAAAGPGRAAQLPKILAGPEAIAEVAAWPCDVVLNGVTGAVGLAATLAAIDAGRVLALANKESLIMGGPLVADRAAPGQIVPVDS